MSHIHSIYDTDNHFIIDPVTRSITTECRKLTLMRYDHNSERYTFEIPRMVEGHDMSLCDKVEIHFNNVTNHDFYTVTDLQLSPDDDSVVIFSWLISDSATQLSGSLSFAIHFECLSDDSIKDYVWNTDSFDKVKVGEGINNTEHVLVEHSDFVTRIEGVISNLPKKLSDLENDLVFSEIPMNDTDSETVYEIVVVNGKVMLREKEAIK